MAQLVKLYPITVIKQPNIILNFCAAYYGKEQNSRVLSGICVAPPHGCSFCGLPTNLELEVPRHDQHASETMVTHKPPCKLHQNLSHSWATHSFIPLMCIFQLTHYFLMKHLRNHSLLVSYNLQFILKCVNI